MSDAPNRRRQAEDVLAQVGLKGRERDWALGVVGRAETSVSPWRARVASHRDCSRWTNRLGALTR